MDCKTEMEATSKAVALVNRMHGKGWRIRVWENIGWHYAVVTDYLSVREYTDKKGTYYSIFMDRYKNTGTGRGDWVIDNDTDPNRLVRRQLQRAADNVADLAEVVTQSIRDTK